MRFKNIILRNITLTLLVLICTLTVQAQTTNSKYDKALADSLGADDFGMKMYVFVILKTGPVKLNDKAKTDSLFAGHFKNMQRLVELGKLTVAGPFEKNTKEYRGLFILNVKTVEEAVTLLETDPTIKAKLLDTEILQWYGSAALPMYLPFSEKVGKKAF